MSPETRRYLYRIGWAASLILVARGVVTGEESALWLGLYAAILGIADYNTGGEN